MVLCEDTTRCRSGQIVEQIRVALTQPIQIDAGAPLMVGMSVGVAIADSAGAAADDLLRDADPAMYTDKASRRNLVRRPTRRWGPPAFVRPPSVLALTDGH